MITTTWRILWIPTCGFSAASAEPRCGPYAPASPAAFTPTTSAIANKRAIADEGNDALVSRCKGGLAARDEIPERVLEPVLRRPRFDTGGSHRARLRATAPRRPRRSRARPVRRKAARAAPWPRRRRPRPSRRPRRARARDRLRERALRAPGPRPSRALERSRARPERARKRSEARS